MKSRHLQLASITAVWRVEDVTKNAVYVVVVQWFWREVSYTDKSFHDFFGEREFRIFPQCMIVLSLEFTDFTKNSHCVWVSKTIWRKKSLLTFLDCKALTWFDEKIQILLEQNYWTHEKRQKFSQNLQSAKMTDIWSSIEQRNTY